MPGNTTNGKTRFEPSQKRERPPTEPRRRRNLRGGELELLERLGERPRRVRRSGTRTAPLLPVQRWF